MAHPFRVASDATVRLAAHLCLEAMVTIPHADGREEPMTGTSAHDRTIGACLARDEFRAPVASTLRADAPTARGALMVQPTTDLTGELDARFSEPDATAVWWSDVLRTFEANEIFWLSTVRKDGRPHVTPLPAMWLDGALHFCTGPEEQKAKNLEANDHVVLTTGTPAFKEGLDVVVEGRAVRVTDEPLLQRLAKMWNDKLEWPFEAVDGGFREKSSEVAGSDFAATGIAHVFAVAPTKVLAFGKGEPFSQTRFRP
jgi:general stress protein 26